MDMLCRKQNVIKSLYFLFVSHCLGNNNVGGIKVKDSFQNTCIDVSTKSSQFVFWPNLTKHK